MASTSVLDIIAKETNGKSYKTFKYSFESMSVPTMDYDEHDRKFTWKKHGETVYHDRSITLKNYADQLLELSQPLFRYFLDGSRHTYKVDDISYAQKVFPVIAGQVGVGCCMRDNGIMKPAYSGNKPLFWRDLVISWPCEKISVNSTTVIKNDIASGLKNSRSIFLQYTINTVICQVSSTVSLLKWSVAE